MKKIFIIVVSYNGGEKLVKFAECVKTIISDDVKLIVIDNASTDDSIKQIENITPFKLIHNKKNLGFAKAVNQGIGYALKNGADKVLLLNPDAFLKNKDFEILIKNQNELVSPIIRFKRDKQTIYDLGGKLNQLLIRPYHLEKRTKPKKAEAIDYVSGCCLLINALAFKKIDFFDERFFLYFEDVDFCLRASGAGLRIAVEPKAEVEHDLSGERERPLKVIYNLIRSHFLFINKWARFPKNIIAYLYWFLISLKIILNKLIYDLSHRFS